MKRSTIFFTLAGAAALYYLLLDEGDASADQKAADKPGTKPGGTVPGKVLPGTPTVPGTLPGTSQPAPLPGTMPGGETTDNSVTLDPQLRLLLTTVPSGRFPVVQDKLSKYFTVVTTPLVGNGAERVMFSLDQIATPPSNASRGDVLAEAIQENGRHVFVPTLFANTADQPMKVSIIGLEDSLVSYPIVKQLYDQGYAYVYLEPKGYTTQNP